MPALPLLTKERPAAIIAERIRFLESITEERLSYYYEASASGGRVSPSACN